MVLDQFGGAGYPLAAQLSEHRFGIVSRRFSILLGMDRPEHVADLSHLRRQHVAGNNAMEVHYLTLPARFGPELGTVLDQMTLSLFPVHRRVRDFEDIWFMPLCRFAP